MATFEIVEALRGFFISENEENWSLTISTPGNNQQQYSVVKKQRDMRAKLRQLSTIVAAKPFMVLSMALGISLSTLSFILTAYVFLGIESDISILAKNDIITTGSGIYVMIQLFFFQAQSYMYSIHAIRPTVSDILARHWNKSSLILLMNVTTMLILFEIFALSAYQQCDDSLEVVQFTTVCVFCISLTLFTPLPVAEIFIRLKGNDAEFNFRTTMFNCVQNNEYEDNLLEQSLFERPQWNWVHLWRLFLRAIHALSFLLAVFLSLVLTWTKSTHEFKYVLIGAAVTLLILFVAARASAFILSRPNSYPHFVHAIADNIMPSLRNDERYNDANELPRTASNRTVEEEKEVPGSRRSIAETTAFDMTKFTIPNHIGLFCEFNLISTVILMLVFTLYTTC